MGTFRNLMLEEISKIATDVAKRKGATLLIDKAGPTQIGISNFIYSDPGYDLTEDVLKEINKDKPASAPSAPAAPGAAPAASGSAPLTVPLPKK
jgi:outer membrane protein